MKPRDIINCLFDGKVLVDHSTGILYRINKNKLEMQIIGGVWSTSYYMLNDFIKLQLEINDPELLDERRLGWLYIGHHEFDNFWLNIAPGLHFKPIHMDFSDYGGIWMIFGTCDVFDKHHPTDKGKIMYHYYPGGCYEINQPLQEAKEYTLKDGKIVRSNFLTPIGE
jgi:hypothetical protein